MSREHSEAASSTASDRRR